MNCSFFEFFISENLYNKTIFCKIEYLKIIDFSFLIMY